MTVILDPGYALLRLQSRLHAAAAASPSAQAASLAVATANVTLARLRGDGPGLRWLDGEALARVERERDELRAALGSRIEVSAQGHKLHLGPLSPGCAICAQGTWGCNFINRLCTRACFFCKRDHEGMQSEPPPETVGNVFLDPGQHVDYIRSFGIRGVGFSGGEPLLVPERLLSHLRAIRAAFGRSVYLWMYTNGDLATPELLTALHHAGLDEIRFNLAARDYELAPVRMAQGIVPAVTVEIPVIPEDFERVRALLPVLQEAGVKFLNLHQLCTWKQSYRAMQARGYAVNADSALSVRQSELCALRLLAAAVDAGLALPINYCSHQYRALFQGRGERRQRALAVRRDGEELTPAGYLRIVDGATVTYAEAQVVRRRPWRSYTPDNLWRHTVARARLADLDALAMACWRRLYLDGADASVAVADYRTQARSAGMAPRQVDERVAALVAVRGFEVLPDGNG